MTMILDKIFEEKRIRVEAAKAGTAMKKLSAAAATEGPGSHRFRAAFNDRSQINIIAEFKRASPSKGVLSDRADPSVFTRAYQAGGACAISVLTEKDNFRGSLDDLRAVRDATDLPILQKDFVYDEFQVYEAAVSGADAILLITTMLGDDELYGLRCLAENELGLDALVEVHTENELERAVAAGARLIGVNNRDLKTFDVSLDISRALIKHAPLDAIMVSESGIKDHDDILELHSLGYSGFLIGETLMRSRDAANELRDLITGDS